MSESRPPEFYGGVACLDFANTLDGRGTDRPEELVHTFADLAKWAGDAGLIEPATVRRLTGPDGLAGPASLAGPGGAATDAALRTARELREAIFQVFVAVGRGAPVPADALAVVQARYTDAMAAARLAPGAAAAGSDSGAAAGLGPEKPAGGSFGWQFDGVAPERVWWPVAVSAVGLLTAGPLDRVKVCAAEAGCVGLFLDTSKNRSRRWCTMDGCGVAAKVERQARRRRTARADS